MPNSPQTNATLVVNKTTGAIEAPVSAAQFRTANSISGGGAPEAHAATHASAGSDPVTLAQSQVTGLVAAIAAKQPLATVLTNTTAAFTTAQETKLAGVATGATANSSDAILLNRGNHTGTQAISTVTNLQATLDAKQPLATVLTNTTAAFTTAQETKLAGIATAATANDTDANLRARSSHTGEQAISTVTGLQDALDDKQPLATVLTNTTAAFTTAQETKLAGIETGAQANVALASQAEAEAGTENTKTMTPLRVAEAIAALGEEGGGGVSIGQAVAYPTTFDGTDIINGSSTTPFADVDAFTTKAVVNSRILKLVTVGASQDDRVRVTLGTAKAAAFDVRICLVSFLSQWAGPDDTYVEVRLSQSDDTQIALFRIYGRFVNHMVQYRLGSKLGAGSPASAGAEFDAFLQAGQTITLQITRDGSNAVMANFGIGSTPLALLPISDGGLTPKVATVSGTLARVEISHHTPSGATTEYVTTFVDYVANV